MIQTEELPAIEAARHLLAVLARPHRMSCAINERQPFSAQRREEWDKRKCNCEVGELIGSILELIANLNGRLVDIAKIIEAVDHRCMAVDGPVTPTLEEMTQAEISSIYLLATGEAPHSQDEGNDNPGTTDRQQNTPAPQHRWRNLRPTRREDASAAT